MKILLIGGSGQLGHELLRTRPEYVELHAPDRQALDIVDPGNICKVVANIAPDLIINCAAYTKVDQAEKDREEAFLINQTGVHNILMAIRGSTTRVLQVSTDFVFDGKSSSPYLIDSPANPLSIYGMSKWMGEQVLLEHYAEHSIIIRTAWLYSSYGKNFVKTILNLVSERDKLNIVADQIGTPTWANSLARVLWFFCSQNSLQGIYHWSDSGIASWYDFACAIMEEGLIAGLIDKPIEVVPVLTSDYPTAAQRPSYSVLDKSQTWELLGYRGDHWRESLRKMLYEYKASGAGAT